MTQVLYVFIGGGLGSICRYLISRLSWEGVFPYPTLIANVISSLILGVLIGLSINEWIKEPHRLLLMTGFCGGFSTFSTFSGELVDLYTNHQPGYALGYAAISIVSGIACILLGMWSVRLLWH